MTPKQAAAIARRIGMELLLDNDWWDEWEDKTGQGKWGIQPSELPTYLATGDRPLRVMEAYRMAVDIHPDPGSAWWAGGDEGRAYGSTPAAAILACAAQIEGEGHE